MDEILAALAQIEGTGELLAQLQGELATRATATDGMKAALKQAEKLARSAEAERDTAKAAAEAATKGESEQVVALKTAAEQSAQALKAEQASHRSFRIESQLASRFNIPAGDDAASRRTAALKLGDWSAVDIDDKGELVGADSAIEALTKAHGYLFTPPAPPARGNGGPPAGSQPRTGTPPAQNEAEAAREAGRAAARMTLGIPTPAPPAAQQ